MLFKAPLACEQGEQAVWSRQLRSHDPILSDPIVLDLIVGSYEQFDPTVYCRLVDETSSASLILSDGNRASSISIRFFKLQLLNSNGSNCCELVLSVFIRSDNRIQKGPRTGVPGYIIGLYTFH